MAETKTLLLEQDGRAGEKWKEMPKGASTAELIQAAMETAQDDADFVAEQATTGKEERVYLPDETWRIIKVASIRGVPDKELASIYEVRPSHIRTRRSRDAEWTAALKTPDPTTFNQTVQQSGQKVANEVERVLSANLASVGENNATLVAVEVAKKIASGLPAIEAPRTWSDMNTAFRMVEKATNRDKASVQVGLALWDGSAPRQAPSWQPIPIEGDLPESDDD